MKTFNKDRKFGVEIEFVGNREAVANNMRNLGVECYTECYNHRTRSYWKIITDASCGFELVSPPLKGDEGLRQLEIACQALNMAGATVNRNCGLHVHHDVNDLDVKAFTNIFALYIKLEETIDKFMPASRRGNANTYCHSLAPTSLQKQQMLDKLKKVKSIEEVGRQIYISRYLKVNAQAYFRHGTIEFRHHSGTTEFEKISNWVRLTQRIVERAKEGNVQYTYKESSYPLLTLQKMLGIIASSGADTDLQKVNQFYVNRLKHFSEVA